jgi:hypothetical protein
MRDATKAEFSNPTNASRLLLSTISTICRDAPRSLVCLSLSGCVVKTLKPRVVARAMQLQSQLKDTLLMVSSCYSLSYCSYSSISYKK